MLYVTIIVLAVMYVIATLVAISYSAELKKKEELVEHFRKNGDNCLKRERRLIDENKELERKLAEISEIINPRTE